MPRAGLSTAAVVAAGASLADEVGLPELRMSLLAERLGVRAPSLYKHVAGQDDLLRRIATRTLDEAADIVGEAIRGRAGADALRAAAVAFRAFVLEHPGRYGTTLEVRPAGPEDPFLLAGDRLLGVFVAVLHGYGLPDDQLPHALRLVRSLLHGFTTLQAAGAFQWATEVDASFEWAVDFTDAGLRALSPV